MICVGMTAGLMFEWNAALPAQAWGRIPIDRDRSAMRPYSKLTHYPFSLSLHT